MQNRQESVVPISFPSLSDCAYVTTGCPKNRNTPRTSHLEIRLYAMLPPEGALIFYMVCNGIKSWHRSVRYMLVFGAHNILPPSSTFSTNCTDLTTYAQIAQIHQ